MRLRVMRGGFGATVQDVGRPGRLRDGLPAGGPLVPELMQAANESLGNPPGAAVLELFRHGLTVEAETDGTVSVDGRLITLAAGEQLALSPAPEAVSYLALPGGIDVPVQLGSCGTLLVAQLGGIDGRMLRAGDRVLSRGDATAAPRPQPRPPLDPSPIRVVPGPDDFPDEALDALLTGRFRISPLGDRTGQRLDGDRLPTPPDRPFSAPMLRGAIQVTHDGTPIVLGPDHPITGGYAVLACVLSSDLGRLARLPPGTEVMFTAIDPRR
jgi:biotin-dependent carboxylase-like uncharacterized protein